MPTPQKEYRTIPLTQGQFAIVDADDYDWLMQWKWHAKWDEHTRGFYAVRRPLMLDGVQRTIRMHREILGLQKGDKRKGDHQNHNTLDNRRENLRIASDAESARNRRVPKNNTTGCVGVALDRTTYSSYIQVDGERLSLGHFPLTPAGLQAASEARKQAAELYFGEFVCSEMRRKGHDTFSVWQDILKIAERKRRIRDRKIARNNTTGAKGVRINKDKYESRIFANGKRKHLGTFPLTPEGLKAAEHVFLVAEALSGGGFTCQ